MRGVLIFALIVSSLFGLTGKEIMQKQKKLQSTKTEKSKDIMVLIDEDGTKEVRKVVKRIKKGNDLTKNLIAFTYPDDVKGVALLSRELSKTSTEQYLYLPYLKRVQRVAESSKKEYFMGTDFTYEDLSPDRISNYHYKLLREEKIKVAPSDKLEECYVVEAVPTKEYYPKTNYSKRILWITKDHFYTKKVEFYAKDGKFIKYEISWDFVNPQGTIYRPRKVAVINKQEHHQTFVKVNNLEINKPMSDKYFTKRYLLNEEQITDE